MRGRFAPCVCGTIGGAALAIALVLATALLIDAVADRAITGKLGEGHDRTDSA